MYGGKGGKKYDNFISYKFTGLRPKLSIDTLMSLSLNAQAKLFVIDHKGNSLKQMCINSIANVSTLWSSVYMYVV